MRYFFIAIIGAILISNFSFQQGILIDELIGYFIIHTIIFNIVLGIFNLWPIPPLDGSNALSFLGLKFGIYKIAELNGKIGNYGMIILMLILATPLSSLFFYPVQKIIQILL